MSYYGYIIHMPVDQLNVSIQPGPYLKNPCQFKVEPSEIPILTNESFYIRFFD